jgi:hypothetical protein
VRRGRLIILRSHGTMEVDGHIMMAEAGVEVAPEAGASEAGAEDASDPPQMQLADEHYEVGAAVSCDGRCR